MYNVKSLRRSEISRSLARKFSGRTRDRRTGAYRTGPGDATRNYRGSDRQAMAKMVTKCLNQLHSQWDEYVLSAISVYCL